MKTMVNLWDSWRYKREISGRRMLQGTSLWLYLVRRLICTPKFTSVHAFIVTHWRSKKYAPQLAPGTESQMDQSIDLAPLKSIGFDLEVSIFTIRFGPNNWSHPLKSIIKANNLPPGSLYWHILHIGSITYCAYSAYWLTYCLVVLHIVHIMHIILY